MRNFAMGWYLIYTRPRHEKIVTTKLIDRGIDCFLPVSKTLRTWHDRKKYVDEPLFPSYVFIYLKDLQNYYDGMDMDGALYYVRTGREIARVTDTVVNNIKLATEQVKDLQVSDKVFRPGQQAVISQGALTGLSCELVEVNRKKMLLVRVDLLQRNILISVPAEHLITT